MQPFVDWIDTHDFYIQNAYDHKAKRSTGAGTLSLFPHQRRILKHTLYLREDGTFPYETLLYSTTKKSGKTQIGAAIGTWYAEESQPGTEIYIAAYSKELANDRVMSDIMYHYKQYNARMDEEGTPQKKVTITKFSIDFPNGTTIKSLANNYKSVAGSRHSLVLWDELWNFVSEDHTRMWEEMTPIATVPHPLRVITTYAGMHNESMLLWNMYVKNVGREENPQGEGKKIKELLDLPCYANGNTFVYWNHEPTMPWQTDGYYADQREQLRPMAYMRLHENRWTDSTETFIPVEWWDHAAKAYELPADVWDKHPYKDFPIFVGIDAATKRDSTAIVGIAYDGNTADLIQVFHKIWTPTQDEELDLENTLGNYLMRIMKMFRIHTVAYDPSQIMQLMGKMRKLGLPVKEFTQGGMKMPQASQLLYDAFLTKRIKAYPADDCRVHIQNTLAKQDAKGFRLAKDEAHLNRRNKKHMDYSIALAIAIHTAVTEGATDDRPILIESRYAESSTWNTKKSKLPWMFVTEDEEW